MLRSIRDNHDSGYMYPIRLDLCFPLGVTVEFTECPLTSEIDNDAYCVCTHDFSLCTHKKFRPVRTMYAVKISGTLTVFGFMRTQIKYL